MLNKLRPVLQPYLDKLIAPFGFINPNLVTVLGLLPAIFFFAFMVEGKYAWAIVAIIASGFDFLDGSIARLHGKTSSFGALLDASLDRISDTVYLISFSFSGLARWELTVITVIFSYSVSYIKAKAEALTGEKNVGTNKMSVGLIQRPERMVLIAVAVLAQIFFPNYEYFSVSALELALSALLVLSFITTLQRFVSTYKLLK